MNLARNPNKDWYSITWTGPPASAFSPLGQLAAIDVLNSMIDIDAPILYASIVQCHVSDHLSVFYPRPQPSSSEELPFPSVSSPATTDVHNRSKSRIGIIVGATVGGATFIAASISLFLFLRYRGTMAAVDDSPLPASPKDDCDEHQGTRGTDPNLPGDGARSLSSSESGAT